MNVLIIDCDPTQLGTLSQDIYDNIDKAIFCFHTRHAQKLGDIPEDQVFHYENQFDIALFVGEWKERTDRISIFTDNNEFLKTNKSEFKRFPLAYLSTFTSNWDVESDFEEEPDLNDAEKSS